MARRKVEPPKTGMLGWYRADSPPGADGTALATWTDLSGKGNSLTQTTPAARPLLAHDVAGMRAVSFRGSQWMNLPAGLAINKRSLSVFVFGARSRNARIGVLGFGSLELNMQICTDGNALTVYYAQGTWDSTVRAMSRGWMGFTSDSSGIALHSGGVVQTASPLGNINLTGGVIGSANGYWPINAAINEVVLYDHGLTADEAAKLRSYFRARYAVPATYASRLVFDGDSLTEGYMSTDGFSYPNQAALLLPGYEMYNCGVSSKTLAQMVSTAPTVVDPLRDATKTRNVCVIWGGTNDLYVSGATVDATYSSLLTYCAARRAAGWRVVVATMLQRSAPQTVEDKRLDYNNRIRAGWQSFADALADFAADARLSNCANGAYFSDGTHLTNLGYGVAAAIAAPAIG